MQYYDSTPYKCCLVVNEFFLTKERIQHSSTLIVFCGLLGLSVLLSRLVHSFLLRMYPIVFGHSWSFCSLSDSFIVFFSLMMSSSSCINISLDFILSYQTQIQHFESYPHFLSAWFVKKSQGNMKKINLLESQLYNFCL